MSALGRRLCLCVSVGLLSHLSVACCPGSPHPESFDRERAAVAAVTKRSLEDVPVYVWAADLCDGATGCCNSCGVYVPVGPTLLGPNSVCPAGSPKAACWEAPGEIALHEFVHAALGLPDHGPAFYEALNAATQLLD